MRVKTLSLILVLLLTACVKQSPEAPPGTATITNIKTSLTIAAIAITATRTALPAFKLDAQDQAAADSILDDIGTARTVLAGKIAPYTSFDRNNATQIRAAAADAVATLKELHDERIDHIKNPKARERVDAAIGTLELVVNLIIGLKLPAEA